MKGTFCSCFASDAICSVFPLPTHKVGPGEEISMRIYLEVLTHSPIWRGPFASFSILQKWSHHLPLNLANLQARPCRNPGPLQLSPLKVSCHWSCATLAAVGKVTWKRQYILGLDNIFTQSLWSWLGDSPSSPPSLQSFPSSYLWLWEEA